MLTRKSDGELESIEVEWTGKGIHERDIVRETEYEITSDKAYQRRYMIHPETVKVIHHIEPDATHETQFL